MTVVSMSKKEFNRLEVLLGVRSGRRPSQSWGSGGLHVVRARPLAFGPDFHQPQNPSHVSTLGQRTSAEIPDRRRTPNLATVPCLTDGAETWSCSCSI